MHTNLNANAHLHKHIHTYMHVHMHTHIHIYTHTHSWTCQRMCSQGWSWLVAWIGAAGSESSSMPAMLPSTGKPSTTLDLSSKAWTWKRSNGFGVE